MLAHRPYPRLLLAPLECNRRYRLLPRLAVQIICPLGRQIQHIATQADRPPHGGPGADPNFGRGLLIHLRVGSRERVAKASSAPADPLVASTWPLPRPAGASRSAPAITSR